MGKLKLGEFEMGMNWKVGSGEAIVLGSFVQFWRVAISRHQLTTISLEIIM